MKEKKPKLILIEWTDSCSPREGWCAIDEIADRGPMKCTTVGFLVADRPDAKTVASTMNHDEYNPEINGVMTIPTHAIHRMRRLDK